MTETPVPKSPRPPVTPYADPIKDPHGAGARDIVVRWDVGAPDENGGQRQARFQLTYSASHGYSAQVTTVISTRESYGISEEFTVSLMRHDLVHTTPAARFSAKGLTAAFDDAMTALRSRFDAADPAIVRHFDHATPIPRD